MKPVPGSSSPSAAPRFWLIVLWSTALAIALTGWDWAESRLATLASSEIIVLVPRTARETSALEQQRADFARDSLFIRAELIDPAKLRQRLATELPADLTASSTAGVGLPPLIELTPHRPLGRLAQLQAFASTSAADWIVFWNAERLASLSRAQSQLRIAAASFILFVLLAGILALARLPSPNWRSGLAAASFGTLAPAAFALLLILNDLPGFGTQHVLLAAGAGLLLAGGLAGMLRQRPASATGLVPRHLPADDVLEPRPAATPLRGVNLAIKESPDERNW